MIGKNLIYALVGASADHDKYGFKILEDLLGAGYQVFPVNPKQGTILDQRVFASLTELPSKPDVVIFVVPPAVTIKVLAEVKILGIKNVWFQPGSESDEAIKFCRDNDIESVAGACIMIRRKE